MPEKPLVSVVIPFYNRVEYLTEAVESVLEQSYQSFEVIVVDDGSSDETAQIQKDFPQVKYIYQENKGVSSARNLGIENASYEWIAFLDSDDTFHPQKLQKQLMFHKKNQELLISYTDEVWIRGDKNVTIPKKFQKVGKDPFLENLRYCNIAPSSVMIHRSVFEKIGYFDESFEVCEDYDLWLRIARVYRIGLLKEKLITKYAGHEDQLSFKHWGMDRFRVKSLEKLLKIEQEEEKTEMIEDLLKEKYTLLLKGAIKYDKIHDTLRYRKKIEEFNKRD